MTQEYCLHCVYWWKCELWWEGELWWKVNCSRKVSCSPICICTLRTHTCLASFLSRQSYQARALYSSPIAFSRIFFSPQCFSLLKFIHVFVQDGSILWYYFKYIASIASSSGTNWRPIDPWHACIISLWNMLVLLSSSPLHLLPLVSLISKMQIRFNQPDCSRKSMIVLLLLLQVIEVASKMWSL